MPSPFPGMNPYLEQDDAWHDFHQSFMPAVRDVLSAQVDPNYFVKIEAALIDAPFEGYLPAVDVERLSYLEVRARRNRQLVAVIELLSPSNKKPGADHDQYVSKRNVLLASMAHFVEIDLLRCGERMPVENLGPYDYCVMVSRYEQRPQVDLWPLGLRDRLPVIPIPLRSPDPDARLDVQQVLHDVYDAAHYGSYIYEGVPEPPLSAIDEAWARTLISARP